MVIFNSYMKFAEGQSPKIPSNPIKPPVSPGFPLVFPPPTPSHPEDQHYATVLEGIGDAAAVDQATRRIVLAEGSGSRGWQPPKKDGKMGKWGISW